MTDLGAVEFDGRRGDRRGVVVVAGPKQLPRDRVVLLLAQCRDPYALRLQQLLRLPVASSRQHPHLPLVVPDRFDLHRVNGGHPHTLPLPATYVIDQTGTVRWAFADTDYTKRAEPADIIAALDALR